MYYNNQNCPILTTGLLRVSFSQDIEIDIEMFWSDHHCMNTNTLLIFFLLFSAIYL